MNICTIVVSASTENRIRYQQMVSALGVECIAVASLTEMFETLKETPCNGLLLDLPTLVKANHTEKSQCNELLRHFPTLRLRWDEKTEQLRCLLYGSIAHAGMSLETFIEEHCRPFKGRRIRRFKRMKLHYNVLLSKDGTFRENETIRTTTLDISESGCALVTYDDWQEDEQIWLRFVEFEDQSPVQATVRKWAPWGAAMEIPNIGVRFDVLSESQKEQIRHPGKAIYEKKQRLE